MLLKFAFNNLRNIEKKQNGLKNICLFNTTPSIESEKQVS